MKESKVLVVEDDPSLREALCDTLEFAGYAPLGVDGGAAALAALDAGEPVGMVITDVQMQPMDGHALLKAVRSRRSDLPVVLMTAYGTIERAVQAMRDGAADYLVKPFEADVVVAMVERFMGRVRGADGEVVATDPRSRELVAVAARVAASQATVLITGESGTGKEVIARYIHRHSPRADGPFVAINCAAIPENMLEATLFGYEKGAFTGAYEARRGKFELADGGTLLLDEISEMDLALQAKLLRVLQEREVERLGGRRTIELDVRVLATSNRNLREEVAAGRFREDLFYRLSVFPLHLPALRERPEDILPLARAFLARHCRCDGATPVLGPEAEARLCEHAWPGNVRELDNVIQRALILRSGPTIGAADLHFEPVASAESPTPAAAPAAPRQNSGAALDDRLKLREGELIIEALREGGGSRKFAAERLGISPRTLRYKLARLREAGVAIP